MSNTGTLATTEAADTLASAGLVAAFGALATTEAADVAAFPGWVQAVGSLAATEAADTAIGNVFVGPVVQAILGAVETQDVVSVAGYFFHYKRTGSGRSRVLGLLSQRVRTIVGSGRIRRLVQ